MKLDEQKSPDKINYVEITIKEIKKVSDNVNLNIL